MSLKIADGLALPEDAVTKTFGILAQRRKGKTYTASVMAEEMVKAELPWVALDPTGAWWGLRAGADGSERGGLPVYVFGGDHGDLPLERTAGRQIADLVVEHPGHYVLDFSHLESKEAERQLATDFAERFYRRKGKQKAPMHLFVDEADMFVPQRSPRGDQRMLGAFESIVRRGGIRGIGTTLISQRAAVVNKNVLEQIDVLICLRVVGPNDQKAIKAYVDAHGDQEQRDKLMSSLASLPLGGAWVWEPGADLFELVQIRERRTFNSSATPDGSQVQVKGLAEVDLDVLRDQLEDSIERAKQEDPRALRDRIAELERRLEQGVQVEPEVVEKEVYVFPGELRDAIENDVVDELRDAGQRLLGAAEKIAADLAEMPTDAPLASQARDTSQKRPDDRPRTITGHKPRSEVQRRAEARDMSQNGDAPRGLQLEMLHALGGFQDRHLSARQLGVLVGRQSSGGYFRNMLGACRSNGWVEGGNAALAITPEGLHAIGGHVQMPTEAEVIDRWRNSFTGLAREIFDILVAEAPNPVSVDELGERTGKEPSGGYFRNMLGALRGTKVAVNAPGGIRASDDLFIGRRG
jgi:hypothetical protein